MSVNKRSQSRVQGSWASAGSQQKPHSKSAAKLMSDTDIGKLTFQPNERVSGHHFVVHFLPVLFTSVLQNEVSKFELVVLNIHDCNCIAGSELIFVAVEAI